MLTQTEARPAAGDVLKNWPIETSDQRPSTHVSAEEFREALSRVASSVSIVSTDGEHGIVGFYSLSMFTLALDDLPASLAGKLPTGPSPFTERTDSSRFQLGRADSSCSRRRLRRGCGSRDDRRGLNRHERTC